MSFLSYADVMRPSLGRRVLIYELALIVAGSLLLALSAQVAIPLPYSPVPVTGQTLAVLLIGVSYGSRRGALCLLAYLSEGIAGLPVLAGGHAGLAYMLGPTGGYLAGFVVAAFVAGFLAERGWDRRWTTSFLAMFVGNAAIYLLGLAWLSRFVGADRVAELGLVPFIPGDLVKLVLGTLLLPIGWKLLPPRGATEGGDRAQP
jgi:biotin transport system substrate-specific component